MNLETICLQSISLITEVGDYIRESRKILTQSQIEVKGKNDFVTEIDKGSELRLVTGLQKIVPEAGFIAEESTSTHKGVQYNWIIDPIDGTTNFIHGVPPHAISVALVKDSEIVLGIVYEITMDECFYTWKDAKSFCNGKEISVSVCATVSNSLIGTGFPYNDYSRMEQFGVTMDYFMKNSHGLRRLGSAATDLAYVACGRYDAFYEYALKPWDVAAGIILVKNAGGAASDFSGGNDCLYSGEMIATNLHIHSEMVQILKPIMT